MSADLARELVQAWLDAFDLSIWWLPLLVAGVGALVGAVAMFVARRAEELTESRLEGRSLDLARQRDTVVEAVRALDLERDKLSDSNYQAERRALLAHGAAALRGLEEEPVSDASHSELDRAVEAAREQLGEERYGAIKGILSGQKPTPERRPAIAPRWEGALWTLGAVAVLLALYLTLRGLESQQDPQGAVAQQEQPAADPEATAALERLRADPTDLDALNTMTNASIRQQQWTEVARYNRRALQVDATDQVARSYAAMLMYRDGELDQATAQLDALLDENPDAELALQYRGIVAAREGDVARAKELLERAIAVTDDQRTRFGLRQLVASLGSPPGGASPAASTEPELSGTITLAEGVDAAIWGEGASIYVSVRSPSGPPMPLRAKRLPPGPFPLEFALSAADSPMARGALPERVTVVIKVDLDGDPVGDDPGAPKAVFESIAPGGEALVVELTE